jgi:hypothetical protein
LRARGRHGADYELRRCALRFVLGLLLAQTVAHVSQPNAIGAARDSHRRHEAAQIDQQGGYVDASAERLAGGHVIMELPSVGATENVMMAAALAAGPSRIENAAREPDIVDLAEVLAKMGARVRGAGSSIIEIEEVEAGGVDHEVTDRTRPEHISSVRRRVATCSSGAQRRRSRGLLAPCRERRADFSHDDGVRCADRRPAGRRERSPASTDQAQFMVLCAPTGRGDSRDDLRNRLCTCRS